MIGLELEELGEEIVDEEEEEVYSDLRQETGAGEEWQLGDRAGGTGARDMDRNGGGGAWDRDMDRNGKGGSGDRERDRDRVGGEGDRDMESDMGGGSGERDRDRSGGAGYTPSSLVRADQEYKQLCQERQEQVLSLHMSC